MNLTLKPSLKPLQQSPRLGPVLFAVLLVMGMRCTRAAEEDAKASDSANEWVRAADNRFLAAAVQKEQAMALLARSDALRMTDHGDAATRASAYVRIGNLEKSAGDLAGMASGNYEKAAINWKRAATEFNSARRGEQARNGDTMAEDARNEARRCAEMAAEAFERAADAYSASKGKSPAQESAASERAATWREKLASSW